MRAILTAQAFKPLHICEPTGWVMHIPFASALVSELKPSMIVELGTHWGNSYFAFCQAVEETRLSTLCYAVDTWKGDHQAGFYDDLVYQIVSGYNQANYARFSYLLRSTFCEAATQFSDNSIDLLHIDGLHTYEAVKEDYETWSPKVRDGGVILLHDIHARHADFGIWRLWEKLESSHAYTFSFTHGHGLGLLIKGDRVPHNPFLYDLTTKQQEKYWRPLFSGFGARILSEYSKQDKARAQVFVAKDGQFTEAISEIINYESDTSQVLVFENLCGMAEGGTVCLRFDPSDQPGLLQIKRLTLVRLEEKETLTEEEIDLQKEPVFTSGILPLGNDGLSFLITHGDPQITLPPFAWNGTDRWHLRVEMQITSRKEAIINFIKTQTDQIALLKAELADYKNIINKHDCITNIDGPASPPFENGPTDG
jgi:hypothetical protein